MAALKFSQKIKGKQRNLREREEEVLHFLGGGKNIPCFLGCSQASEKQHEDTSQLALETLEQ